MKTFLDKPQVRIVSGPHAGRQGNVVSIPWLGNLWHWWMQVNVLATPAEVMSRYGDGEYGRSMVAELAGGLGPREWLTVYRSQVEFL